MNLLQNPKTDLEKGLVSELRNAKQQISDIRRQITGLERDNRLLSIMSENADRLRRSNEAEKKLQYLYNDMLLKFCQNMLFLFDKELRLQLATRSSLFLLPFGHLEEMQNLTPENIFGAKMDSAWIKRVVTECREVMESRDACHYNGKIVFNDEAGQMDAQIDIYPVIDEDNQELRGVIVSINDITELTVVKERAEEVSRSKSSFLANISHEIHMPMNAIKGLSELLMLTELSELQQAYVSTVIRSSNSLLAIVNDILDFSKIDANKVDIIKSEYNLGTLLKDVCSIINLRAEDKDLVLNTDIDPKLPSILYGDDTRLKQVLVNVLSNAVKYTEKGTIVLSVSGKMEGENKVQLRFEVRDTGIGIRHEELPNLFEAFSRTDLRLNCGIMGTGLGLAISKQLMLAMGGGINVESTYGQGSVFSFWLPQKVVNPASLAEVQYPERKKALLLDAGKKVSELCKLLDSLGILHVNFKDTKEQALPGWEDATHCIYFEGYQQNTLAKLRGSLPDCSFIIVRDIRRALGKAKYSDMAVYEPLLVNDLAMALNLNRKADYAQALGSMSEVSGNFKVVEARALVVDDNSLNLMVSGEILRAFGFEVDEADSGEAVVQICQETVYDIIFMDHMMPGMDGIETTTHIREVPGKNLKTPVVALTTNVVSGMKDYFLRCGMDDMVSKPIEFSELSRVLITWLPQSKIRKESPDQAQAESAKQGMVEFDLVGLLDEFGMYANDVMRELHGALPAYVARLGYASRVLGNMVDHLMELVALGDWKSFSRAIADLKDLLHGIGARDCSDRAKKMEVAAAEGNIDYVHQDFKSLMGNMYMLEKKLEALVPLATSDKKYDAPLNDPMYLYRRLRDLQMGIEGQKLEEANTVMEDLVRNSFDHDLDLILNEVRWALEDHDFDAARKYNAKAVAYYKKTEAFKLAHENK